ncbi:hypothetical protein [Paenibacillus glacialis]|nr:hypothetical protein [Paenibacillus glacialis]
MGVTTCRDELLVAVKVIVESKGINEFAPIEVVKYMMKNNTRWI